MTHRFSFFLDCARFLFCLRVSAVRDKKTKSSDKMAMAMNPIQVLRGGAEEEKVLCEFIQSFRNLETLLIFFKQKYFRQKQLD